VCRGSANHNDPGPDLPVWTWTPGQGRVRAHRALCWVSWHNAGGLIGRFARRPWMPPREGTGASLALTTHILEV